MTDDDALLNVEDLPIPIEQVAVPWGAPQQPSPLAPVILPAPTSRAPTEVTARDLGAACLGALVVVGMIMVVRWLTPSHQPRPSWR